MKPKTIIHNPGLYFLFFFVCIYFYFYIIFDSTVYYHYHQPVFLFDKTFLKEFLIYPGGLIEWISQFILQFLYFNWLGSLIISILFSSIFIIIYKLIEKIMSIECPLIPAFLPLSLLLFLQNDYNFTLLISGKYLFSLVCFLLYIKITNKYKILIIPLSGLIYYILGGWVYLFYIVLCVLYELLFSKNRKKFIIAGFNILIYFLYPYVAARYLFIITITEAYFYIIPYELYNEPFLFKPNLFFYLFFLYLPVLIPTIFFYTKNLKSRLKLKNKRLSIFKNLLVQSIIAIILGCLIWKFSFKQQEKHKIQTDYFAEQKQWQEVLNLSFKVTEYDRLLVFNTNRALYHTGQLLDNLFSWNQYLGIDGLFINRIIGGQIAVPASELYFELGHINASQVMAYEGQTKFKYNPIILKQLVLTNIINEKYTVAEKFLGLLKKSILHRNWARHYENYLYNKSLIENDRLIQSKRKLKPKFDFFIDYKQPNYDLRQLLKESENNKMAFEYLMAYYLLECKIGDLIQYLEKFKDLGYKKLPRHIEEALLLYKLMSPEDISFNKYNIDPHTIKKFMHFNKILYQNRENDTKARQLLRKKFINTYWYYVRYINPNKTKVKLRKRKIDERIL